MASSASHIPTGTRLRYKVCVVTDAASDLGRAIAFASTFEAEKAETPTHEAIRKRHEDNKAVFVKTDVTKGEEVERVNAFCTYHTYLHIA